MLLGLQGSIRALLIDWLLPEIVSTGRIHRLGNAAALLLVNPSPLGAAPGLAQAQNLGSEQLSLDYSPHWSSLTAHGWGDE